MGIPDHLTCLLRNLNAGQEAIVRTRHGTTEWLKTVKEYNKAVYYHPDYLTYMQSLSCQILRWINHKLESRLLGEILKKKKKVAGRNINNLRYVDDTTLVAESEEEPKSLLRRVKEESEKAGLKLNIQKLMIMASGHITSWQIHGEKVETVTDFIFLGSKITIWPQN